MTDASGSPRKGPAAFRTISEASAELGVPQHMLRFWETKFAFVRPMKRAGGRRFYRPQDLDVLRGVRALLQEEGYTIKGVQKLHKEQGLKRLAAASGLGEAAAARLADELEAEVAADAAPAPVESISPRVVAPATAVERDDDVPGTADLFESPPRPAHAPTSPVPHAELARPVLAADARRRLAEVLTDLEATKAGIDALLQES